jgi:hypothetical protein
MIQRLANKITPKFPRPLHVATSSLLLLALSGCILPTKHKLPIPKAPDVIQTATADQLVTTLNGRWKDFDSLRFVVDIKASMDKNKEGTSTEYPVLRGNILMRKLDEKIRVLGQSSMVGIKMFDLASDGENFTLYVPVKGKAYKGKNKVRRHSAMLEENLTAKMFYDAMIVRGLEPNDLYAVTADTVTVEDPTRKNLYLTPEYILSIMQVKPGSQELSPVRVVYFHREDLLPYEQDFYDADGNLETQVYYSKYSKTDDHMYPGLITINVILDDAKLQLVMTVEKVDEKIKLTDDQFQIKLKDDIKIENLEDAKPADTNTVKPTENSPPKQ